MPAEIAARLAPGMAARVRVGGDAPLAASVLRRGAAADPRTGTVEVDCVIAHPAGLASGASASASFAAAVSTGAAQHIPAEALVDARDGAGHVYLVDRGGVARLAPIRVLGISDDDVRVAGLPMGARVITEGAGFVADGERVTVLAR